MPFLGHFYTMGFTYFSAFNAITIAYSVSERDELSKEWCHKFEPRSGIKASMRLRNTHLVINFDFFLSTLLFLDHDTWKNEQHVKKAFQQYQICYECM